MSSVVPKPASTVVLVRNAEGGPEVLLLRRPNRGFAAGAWVFPGGMVDADDYRLEPPSAEEPALWASTLRMNDPPLAWAHVVAAVRETWEETGLLLGEATASMATVQQARQRLLDGREPMSRIAPAIGFRLATLLYLSRWITPESAPRRYDTRFFVVRWAEGQEIVPAAAEVEQAIWTSPARALERVEGGELRMMTPTRYTLHALTRFRSAEEMLARLSTETPPSYLPRMRTTPEGVIIDVHSLDPG